METFHDSSVLVADIVSTLPIRNGNEESPQETPQDTKPGKYLTYKEWKQKIQEG